MQYVPLWSGNFKMTFNTNFEKYHYMVCGIICIEIFFLMLALTLCACANEDDYN